MGSTCASDIGREEFGVFNPVELDFKRVQPVILPPSINASLNAISTISLIQNP